MSRSLSRLYVSHVSPSFSLSLSCIVVRTNHLPEMNERGGGPWLNDGGNPLHSVAAAPPPPNPRGNNQPKLKWNGREYRQASGVCTETCVCECVCVHHVAMCCHPIYCTFRKIDVVASQNIEKGYRWEDLASQLSRVCTHSFRLRTKRPHQKTDRGGRGGEGGCLHNGFTVLYI